MGDEAKKKENSYGYTAGLGLVGALAGAALTKLLEDEDKKATLKDYLIGSGLGLGVGALGGRLIDTADPSDVKDPQNETLKKDKEDAKAAKEAALAKAESPYKWNKKAFPIVNVPLTSAAALSWWTDRLGTRRDFVRSQLDKGVKNPTVPRGYPTKLSGQTRKLMWLAGVADYINIADALSKATGKKWFAPWRHITKDL